MIIYSTENITKAPLKIVSLVPSYSQLICQLGGTEQLVGKTKFCIHPAAIDHLTHVGGTKKVNLERVEQLQPDIIVANKEENSKEDIEALAQHYTVYLSSPNTVEDSFELIASFERLILPEKLNTAIVKQNRFKAEKLASAFKGTVAYLIWKGPLMAAGRETFIDSMLSFLGFTNSIQQNRYPQLDEKDLVSMAPDYIFLSTEPYRFKASHVEKFNVTFPKSKTILVDGEAFSWHGLIFENHYEYLQKLLKNLTI